MLGKGRISLWFSYCRYIDISGRMWVAGVTIRISASSSWPERSNAIDTRYDVSEISDRRVSLFPNHRIKHGAKRGKVTSNLIGKD